MDRLATLILVFLAGQAFAHGVSEEEIRLAEALYGIDDVETYGCDKKDYDCRYRERNLCRDTKDCKPDEAIVETLPMVLGPAFARQIEGRIRYLGLFAKRYSYLVRATSGGGFEISVKIYIKNAKDYSEGELAGLQTRLRTAEGVWARRNPYSYPLSFHFDLTDDSKATRFRVKLHRKDTRGPYDTNWSLRWTSTTIAHELGHMLGLDDEYKNRPWGGDTSDCHPESLMCRSWSGSPRDYHYYLIMRRAYCQRGRAELQPSATDKS